jgi:hypothetical protein
VPESGPGVVLLEADEQTACRPVSGERLPHSGSEPSTYDRPLVSTCPGPGYQSTLQLHDHVTLYLHMCIMSTGLSSEMRRHSTFEPKLQVTDVGMENKR